MNPQSMPDEHQGAADPRHAAILKGMATVAVFALFGKVASAGKEMAVAFRYGLAPEVDAYQFLYNLLSWPVGIWTSVLAAVLVPLAASLQAADRASLARFRAELLGWALVAGAGLALLAWVAVRLLLASHFAGLPPRMAPIAAAAMPVLLPMLPLGILIALQSAWLLAAGSHANTLYESVPTLCIGAAVLVSPGGGIAPLAWGTLLGCAAHLLALAWPALRSGALDAPRLAWSAAQWRPFWQGFGIMLAGQALMSLTVVIDQFHALALGSGAIATLGYANRVLSLVLALAAIAVSRATLPVFSQSGAGGGERLRALAFHWAGLMFLAGAAAVLACHVLAPAGMAALFERGEFGAGDTERVVRAFRFGLPQLPFYFASMVLVSYALSQRRYRLIFWSGVIGCAAKVLGNEMLAPRMGVDGIALATTFVYASNALFFHLALRRTGARHVIQTIGRGPH